MLVSFIYTPKIFARGKLRRFLLESVFLKISNFLAKSMTGYFVDFKIDSSRLCTIFQCRF